MVALLTENNLRAFEVYWAAMRSGLYITAVNWHLKPNEVAYIVNDSGATALIVSAEQAATAEALTGLTTGVKLRLAYGGQVKGYGGYEDTIAAASDEPFDDRPGSTMLYSSGTTGRPKGVRPTLPDRQVTEPGDALAGLASMFFGVTQESVYLSPGPIYHAAPLRWSGSIQVLGGTVVLTKRFDAGQVLAAIAGLPRHPRAVRADHVRADAAAARRTTGSRYDVSSLRVAIHAAAPCPVEVKQKMITWWGPVLFEYYAGTEGNGMTAYRQHHLAHQAGHGGPPHHGHGARICADDGTELPAGRTGSVYFESEDIPFSYHNDPGKTRAARAGTTPTGRPSATSVTSTTRASCYLTDRRTVPIVSGGVNIYPREVEEALAPHPAVADVAVIGIRDEEMGQRVHAVVQPAQGVVPGPELEQEIIAFVKSRIAGFKAPRTVRFVDSLPRSEAGKLMKTELKARYAGT